MESGWIYPKLSFSSSNRPLVEASIIVLGGGMTVVLHKGEQTQIQGKKFIVQEDILEWHIHYKDMKKLFPQIYPHMILKGDEFKQNLGIR